MAVRFVLTAHGGVACQGDGPDEVLTEQQATVVVMTNLAWQMQRIADALHETAALVANKP